MTELTDRVALATGASRGIGAAIAVRLAEAGAHVAVGCGRHLGAAEQVAERFRSTGRRAAVISGDLPTRMFPGGSWPRPLVLQRQWVDRR
jgi:3-oxoacyl-[acyl-carrier protein] reductase